MNIHKRNEERVHSITKDPKILWDALVEETKDPLNLSRCRVRIYGIHSFDKSKVPNDNLPFAETLSNNDLFKFETNNLNKGDIVSIYFQNGDYSHPIIIGRKKKNFSSIKTFTSTNNSKNKIKDNENIEASSKNVNFKEPTLEMKDTLGTKLSITNSNDVFYIDGENSQYTYFNNSGSYINYTKDGVVSSKVIGNGYIFNKANLLQYIGGDRNLLVIGNDIIEVKGDSILKAKSINIDGGESITTKTDSFNLDGGADITCKAQMIYLN